MKKVNKVNQILGPLKRVENESGGLSRDQSGEQNFRNTLNYQIF